MDGRQLGIFVASARLFVESYLLERQTAGKSTLVVGGCLVEDRHRSLLGPLAVDAPPYDALCLVEVEGAARGDSLQILVAPASRAHILRHAFESVDFSTAALSAAEPTASS